MIRLFLRALNAPVLILLAIIGVAIQTSLFAKYPLIYLQPDILLIIIIWCSLKRSFLEGGILTLILANIAEIHSAAPQGIMLVAYMTIYLLTRAAAKLLVVEGRAIITAITVVASVLWKFAYLSTLLLLGTGSNQWTHLLIFLVPAACIEGLMGFGLYRALEKFDWVTYKNERARQQIEDELQLDGEGL